MRKLEVLYQLLGVYLLLVSPSAHPQVPSGRRLTKWHSVGMTWSSQQVPSRAAALSGISVEDKKQSLSEIKETPVGTEPALDGT